MHAIPEFDEHQPQERGNPLDAVSRDAEPIEDESGADSCAVTAIAKECGVSRAEVSEILLCAAEHGIGAVNGKRAAVSDETRKWRELSAILFKVVQHLQPPAHYSGEEMDVLSCLRTRFYVTLRAFDLSQFDFINGNLNTLEFARTLKVKRMNYVVGRNGKGRTKLTDEERSKQAVNKALMEVQKLFQLQPRKDQRNGETRAKQSDVRNSKLVKS